MKINNKLRPVGHQKLWTGTKSVGGNQLVSERKVQSTVINAKFEFAPYPQRRCTCLKHSPAGMTRLRVLVLTSVTRGNTCAQHTVFLVWTRAQRRTRGQFAMLSTLRSGLYASLCQNSSLLYCDFTVIKQHVSAREVKSYYQNRFAIKIKIIFMMWNVFIEKSF